MAICEAGLKFYISGEAMGEIKKDLKQLKPGKKYKGKEGDFLIREEHTIADVVRFLIGQSGGSIEEILYCAHEEEKQAREDSVVVAETDVRVSLFVHGSAYMDYVVRQTNKGEHIELPKAAGIKGKFMVLSMENTMDIRGNRVDLDLRPVQ